MKRQSILFILIHLFITVSAIADYIIPWGQGSFGQLNTPTGNDFIAVSAFNDGGLALRSDGSLVGWGDPTNTGRRCFVPSGNGFVAIAGASNNCIALKSDGSIVWWETSDTSVKSAPSGNDFKAIAALTGQSGLALRKDGSLVGWGKSIAAKVPSGNDFIAISGGDDLGVALRSNGSIVGWGNAQFDQFNVPAGNDYVKIAAGSQSILAITSDGKINVWGSLARYQITKDNDFTDIAAWGTTGVALKSDGSLISWGSSDDLKNIPSGNSFTAIEVSGGYGFALSTEPCLEEFAEVKRMITEIEQKIRGSGYRVENSPPLHDLLNIKASLAISKLNIVASERLNRSIDRFEKSNKEASEKLNQSIERFETSSTEISNRMFDLTVFLAALAFIQIFLIFWQIKKASKRDHLIIQALASQDYTPTHENEKKVKKLQKKQQKSPKETESLKNETKDSSQLTKITKNGAEGKIQDSHSIMTISGGNKIESIEQIHNHEEGQLKSASEAQENENEIQDGALLQKHNDNQQKTSECI
ncbi:MAG: hypothetical protein JW837_02150 [Sedimentisphaerales bacterium]|nr:hypothetical protein [Sedimentisphaerales bacterium]